MQSLKISIFQRTLALALMYLLCSCEKEIRINPKEGKEEIVVEGHIENGIPPYVVITRSQPYFSSISLKDLSNSFIHDAVIKISDGTYTVTLQEVSSDTLPPFLLDIILGQLGIKLTSKDTTGFKIFAYITSDPKMFGQAGRTYTLDVQTEQQHLYSVTTIPATPSIDSVWAVPHPSNDTLATLNVRYSDPVAEDNYIRYFTSTNGDPFYPPFFLSVLDDRSIFDVNGKTFDFPIEKGHNRNYIINFDTFTYFTKGDTAVIRWCAIDKAHFDFWSTAEYDRGSTGNPFASPTRIKSNISNGLGIWGGYSQIYYPIVIPK